jgi:hypothetical protein
MTREQLVEAESRIEREIAGIVGHRNLSRVEVVAFAIKHLFMAAGPGPGAKAILLVMRAQIKLWPYIKERTARAAEVKDLRGF